MSGYNWTEEQDEYLRRHAASRTLKQLADHLERTERATGNRCRSLGLKHLDGRSSNALAVELGQLFERLTVLELGHYKGSRAARVSCSGPHEPVEKWVNLHALTSGAVVSCGCQRSEDAAQRARQRNTSGAPPRLGTGQKGLPSYVKYIPKGTSPGPENWRIDDDGRECGYKGEGNCEHTYKSWEEYSVGNSARGRYSWCKACRATYNQSIPADVRREKSLAMCCRAANISVETFWIMTAVYDGRCWLCKEFEVLMNEDETVRRLSIDHDHDCCGFVQTPGRPLCGKCIRGLCCHRCNRQVLGNVESVGLDKVMQYVFGAQAVAQAIIGQAAGT